MGPHEQRQPEPGEAGGAHAVDGHDEVQAGEDRREAGDEHPQAGRDHVGVGVGGAVGGIEGPARVHSPADEHEDRERRADHVDVPAREVQPREGQVARADHEGDEEVSQHGGDGRDEEEEHHDDAVHREQLVVGLGLDEVAGGSDELQPDEDGERAAQEEHERHAGQIEQGDALVVGGEQPGLHAISHVEIVHPWRRRLGRCGGDGRPGRAALAGSDLGRHRPCPLDRGAAAGDAMAGAGDASAAPGPAVAGPPRLWM